jgi:hypothetical protein
MLTALTVGTAVWSISTSPRRLPAVVISSRSPTVVTFASPTASTSTTAPPVVVNPAVPTTIIDPNTYHPSYDTVPSLVDDSAFVFIGTAKPLYQDPNLGTATPFEVDTILAGMQPDTLPVPAIPEGSPGDTPVVVGQQYVVFLAIDLTGQAEPECTVGGDRGLFHYNASTQAVTRVSTSPSQIPTSLSLARFIALIPNPNSLATKVPTPSVCSSSVTGS